MKSKNGINLYWYIEHFELENVLLNIISIINKKKSLNKDKYFELFIFRELANKKLNPFINRTILDILFNIRSISTIFNDKQKNNKVLYFLNDFPWFEVVSNFALENNVILEKLKINLLKFYYLKIFNNFLNNLRIIKNIVFKKKENIKLNFNNSKSCNIAFLISIQINNPILFSKNTIIKNDHSVYLNRSNYISSTITNSLKKSGFNFFDLTKFYILPFKNENYFNIGFNNLEKFILNSFFNKFNNEKNFWNIVFNNLKIKIVVTDHYMDNNSIPMVAVLNKLNGISVFYTQSYYEYPEPAKRFICDVYLSNSINTVKNINKGLSKYTHILPIGYLNSYKNETLKEKSQNLRNKLLSNGAKKIICFFDQGELEDNMYGIGYEKGCSGYKFLIEKLLENNWLGLIIKPKKPGLLNKKTKRINDLILKGLDSGRLHIYTNASEFHTKNFSNPPCEAAMASDLAIHDTVVSATAGIEAYLSGTRTVFFDFFNFFQTRFHANSNSIVFTNWDNLWERIIRYFEKRDNFGIWDDQILNEIDNFRDNISNTRLFYLAQKLQVNLSKHKDSSLAIENSVEDYIKKWKL